MPLTTNTDFLLDQKATYVTNNSTQHDTGSSAHENRTVVMPAEETASETNRTIEMASRLSPVTQLSGVLELQQIMAGSAPDATPPSQNILGSPPKRDIAINPVQSNLSVHGESAGEYVHDAQGGVAIPSSRRKSDF
jgi:hypothetical protein